MAKQTSKKTNPGTRNADRPNGKAWKKRKFDDKGRALTGRGKPTGRTVKGVKRHFLCPQSCSCNATSRV